MRTRGGKKIVCDVRPWLMWNSWRHSWMGHLLSRNSQSLFVFALMNCFYLYRLHFQKSKGRSIVRNTKIAPSRTVHQVSKDKVSITTHATKSLEQKRGLISTERCIYLGALGAGEAFRVFFEASVALLLGLSQACWKVFIRGLLDPSSVWHAITFMT